MSIERQDNEFFVRVLQGQYSVRPVPMPPEDAFYVGSLVLRQLKVGHPGLDDVGITALLREAFR